MSEYLILIYIIAGILGLTYSVVLINAILDIRTLLRQLVESQKGTLIKSKAPVRNAKLSDVIK